jgi:hypothetical protein
MATDYDAPRVRPEDEPADESLDALRSTSNAERLRSGADLGEERDPDDALELPGADLSGAELSVRVLPKQKDEFTCTSCFLVSHQSQLARSDPDVCLDCA